MRRTPSVQNEIAAGEAAPHLSNEDLEAPAAVQALVALADVILMIGRDGVVRSVRSGADRSFDGLSAFLHRRWTDLLAPDSLAKGREILESAFDAGRSGLPPRPREVNILGATGSVPLRIVVVPHGEVALCIGQSLEPQAELQRQVIDIQQGMERDYARLRGVEARYRMLFQMAATPMLIVDVATRKVAEANAACPPVFGLSAGRLIGRTLPSLFDEHDWPSLDGLLASAIGVGEGKGAILRAAAGEARFDVSAHLFRQEGESLLLLQVRPDGEAIASNQVAPLSSLVERLPEGFVVTDGDGLILEVNRAFLDLAGVPTASAATGRSLGEWLGRAAADFGALLSSIARHGTVRSLPGLVRGAYGAEEPVEISAVGPRRAGGAPDRFPREGRTPPADCGQRRIAAVGRADEGARRQRAPEGIGARDDRRDRAALHRGGAGTHLRQPRIGGRNARSEPAKPLRQAASLRHWRPGIRRFRRKYSSVNLTCRDGDIGVKTN